MATPKSHTTSPGSTSTGGLFTVDPERPLPDAGGGLPAFAASGRPGQPEPVAVQTRHGWAPRAQAITALALSPIEGVLRPVGHGLGLLPDGSEAYFVFSEPPPGPSLARAAFGETRRRFREDELIDWVLRPAALALERLQAKNVTHRAINPGNVFRGPASDAPVVLGPAWAAPPASLQAALYEPPSVAMCPPCCRGDGTAADDVYALGMTLLVLALGRDPLAGLSADAIIRRKLSQGSFLGVAGDERLPPVLGDLIRGMLAEDPDHRPAPRLLTDQAAARARRVAARPTRRAHNPIELGGVSASDTRTLAYAIATEPALGAKALRSGAVDRWLRREVGDSGLALELEELVSRIEAASRDGDSMLAMRAVAKIDPLAPLCWRGLSFWPDGLGFALGASIAARESAKDAQQHDPRADGVGAPPALFEEVVTNELCPVWGHLRADRIDIAMLRTETRRFRGLMKFRGPAGGIMRAAYGVNRLLPCCSLLMAGRVVVEMADLLRALDAAAADVDRKSTQPIDAHVAAFIAARQDSRIESDLTRLGDGGAAGPLAQLSVLANLQARFHPHPLPGLAGWIAEQAGPMLEIWRNKARREDARAQIQAIADAGHLTDMLRLLNDPDARKRDAEGAARAQAAVARIDSQLRDLDTQAAGQIEQARGFARDIVSGAGLSALAGALTLAALG